MMQMAVSRATTQQNAGGIVKRIDAPVLLHTPSLLRTTRNGRR